MNIDKATEQQVTEAIARFEEKIRRARLDGLALKAVRAQQYTAP